MKRKVSFALVFLFGCIVSAVAQNEQPGNSRHLDLSGSIGRAQGATAVSYTYQWKIGKKKKFEAGAGVRFTSYFGNNQYFITAPARITSGKTGPAVFFIENKEENIDSLLVLSSQINALNLSINLGYHISKKLYAGFNIDAIGFSFGKTVHPQFISSNTSVAAFTAKPTPFNVLLISDNDRGTLNSEFFFVYSINKRLGIKAGFQFLFTEYKTDADIQKIPELNDRFRNKVSAFLFGVTYQLK